MKKRRVGRLVVSWNWGRGLGIVTQTSLLRVFDPIEMYGVIENLQQTIQQLEVAKTEYLPSSSSGALSSSLSDLEPRQVTSELNPRSRKVLHSLLDSIDASIKHLIAEPNLSAHQQRSHLNSILDTLEQLYRQINF
jgi:hypothetical protein